MSVSPLAPRTHPDDAPPRGGGCRVLAGLRSELRWRFLGLGAPKAPFDWDREYASGQWDFLDSAAESSRLLPLAALVDRHRPPGSRVLDVGCGTAPLLRYLSPDAGATYVGMDVSAVAIRRAHRAAPSGTPLYVASADGPVPFEIAALGPFGVIVMSDVLQYARSPRETLARFSAHLRPAGVFLISVRSPARHRALFSRIERELEVRGSIEIPSSYGPPWLFVVALPHRDLRAA